MSLMRRIVRLARVAVVVGGGEWTTARTPKQTHTTKA